MQDAITPTVSLVDPLPGLGYSSPSFEYLDAKRGKGVHFWHAYQEYQQGTFIIKRLVGPPNLQFSASQSFSMSMWVKLMSGPYFLTVYPAQGLVAPIVFSGQNLNLGTVSGASFTDSDIGKVYFGLFDRQKLTTNPSAATVGENWDSVRSTAGIAYAFHYVTVVREVTATGYILKIYVDGLKAGESVFTTAAYPIDLSNYLLGAKPLPCGGCGISSNVVLDDFTIYNKALSDQEVAGLMASYVVC